MHSSEASLPHDATDPSTERQQPRATGPTHVASRTWKATDRWAWAFELPVSGIARAVAGCIAYHANDKTGQSWPGMGTIAKETGFCRRAVVPAIKELDLGGHVTVTRFKVGKKNTANRYQLPPMGSAPDALPSAPDALGGGAPDALESVRTESVKNSTAAREQPNTEQTINPDGYRGGRIRNCPQCHTHERGHEDTCQYCDWTREAWDAR